MSKISDIDKLLPDNDSALITPAVLRSAFGKLDIDNMGTVGPKGDKGEQGSSVEIMGEDTTAGIKLKPRIVGQLWMVKESASPLDGHALGWNEHTQVWEDKGQFRGDIGLQGVKGDIGPMGPTGANGRVGQDGVQGIQGIPGTQGPRGNDGTGVTIAGSDTEAIITAKTGRPAGEMWIITDTGPKHGQGLVSDGKDAWTNVGQIQGKQGIQGQVGPAGPKGSDGRDGQKGADGHDGKSMSIVGSGTENNIRARTGHQGDIRIVIDPKNHLDGHGLAWQMKTLDWKDIGLIRGFTGDTGATGAIGPIGPIGQTGPKGDAGNDATIDFASIGEVKAGTVANKAVTPLGLAGSNYLKEADLSNVKVPIHVLDFITAMGIDTAEMPTVAGDKIIESGSDASGTWTIFSNGFMILTAKVFCLSPDTAIGSMFKSSTPVTWNFHKEFREVPGISGADVMSSIISVNASVGKAHANVTLLSPTKIAATANQRYIVMTATGMMK